MPSVVKLNMPVSGMKFYYNVSAKVGPYGSGGCVNNALDVELVNLLLWLAFPASEWPKKMKAGMVTRGSTFDAVTGFLIYVLQDAADDPGKSSKNERPDGMVSVGNALGNYGQGTMYTILYLNGSARQANPAGWARLYEQPGVSPALRAQITHAYPA